MRRRNGRNNLCKLNQRPISDVERFLAKYKLFWQGRFASLDEHLKEDAHDRDED